MIGLRSKLLLGFGGMLLIVLTVSVLAQTVMEHYSRAIQKSYREDYESVAACQAMKEAVEQMDRSAQDALWDHPPDPESIRAARAEFARQLGAQREEATLPGEAAATDELARRWTEYDQAYPHLFEPGLSVEKRRDLYLTQLTPRSQQVRDAAQQLIRMNLDSILSVPRRAQQSASQAHWAMRLLTVSGVAIAVLFAAWIGRMILRPIRALTDSVHEIERGNFDLSVPIHAHDELGALATAFNNMAGHLRRYRQIAQDRLVRTEQTTQMAIDSLPDAVLVITPERRIELANVAARKLLGVMPGDEVGGGGGEGMDEASSGPSSFPAPGTPGEAKEGGIWQSTIDRPRPGPLAGSRPIRSLPPEYRGRETNPRSGLLADLLERIADAEHATELSDYQSILQVDQDGQTRYFLPRTAPIADDSRRTLGATVVLADVTGLRRLDEMKNSLLSLVSHELKTPLTSARMVLHLVTERKVGPLTDKQADLLQAAREDVDRLFRIVESLLDMSRIESGRALMEFEPIAVEELVRRSIEPLAGMFQDVELHVAVPPELPDVFADPLRIGHVFANLLMNALRHTSAGGRVTIEAARRGGFVEFLVRDTGCGIPRQYLHRVFEKFFRVPGEGIAGGGSGLGLAIAKEIIESHRGQIRIDSTEGIGATVAFTLPVCPARSDENAPRATEAGNASPTSLVSER